MLTTLRSERENIDEAIETLRFAQRAKNVSVKAIAQGAAHGALPHRAPSTKCTADLVRHVWLQVIAVGAMRSKAEVLTEELNEARDELGTLQETLKKSGVRDRRYLLSCGAAACVPAMFVPYDRCGVGGRRGEGSAAVAC